MLKPVGGFIYTCSYCGEQCLSKSKYCNTCKTQTGRKKLFEENVEIIKENKAKGYNTVKALKDWK